MERQLATSPTPTVCGDEVDFKKFLDDGCNHLTADCRHFPVLPDVEKVIEKPKVGAQQDNGSRDPDNPLNWPFGRRVYHTTVPALIALCVTFGSSVYTPGVAEVAEKFGVSTTVALLGLSLYVLGLAFGPMLAAPLSESQGRLAVYRVSVPLAAVFTLGAGFSQNMASLAVCRFFAGFFGSPCLAVGAGSITDIWPPVHRAVATSFYLLAPFLGPALGPVIGGFAAESKGWRWTQWPMLMALAFCGLYLLPMKETYMKIIVQQRAKALNMEPPPRGPSGIAALKFLFTVTLVRPMYMLYAEPIVIFWCVYVGFNFAVLFGFFDAFPLVFGEVYHFSSGLTGLTFLGIGIGCLFAVVSVVIIDRRLYRPQYEQSIKEGKGGIVAPEQRLYAAMLGSLGLPVGLFWFAWTARSDVHWISPVLAAIPFGWGNLMIFTSGVLYTMDVYGPLNGASAAAANGLVRYVAGAAFPLFIVQMYHRLGINWATSLFGFVSVAMLPIPWVFFRYGHYIRQRSHYETSPA